MSTFSEKEELKSRLKAKKKRLEAELEELKATSSSRAREVKQELREAEEYLRQGWDDMSEKVAGKINKWLDRS